MWSTVLEYLAITAICCFAYLHWTRRKIRAALAKMHGPMALPLIGHAYLVNDFASQEKIVLNFTRHATKYPSPIVVYMGPLINVILFEPSHVQTVLNSPHCLSKSKQYDFFQVSQGIFSAKAPLWKRLRKEFNPCFGPNMLNNFVPIFNEKSATFVNQLDPYVGKEQRDLSHEIMLCSLDTILTTAFGVNLNLQLSPEGSHYVKCQEEFMEIVTDRMFTPYHYPQFLYRLSKKWKREQACKQGMLDISLKALKTRNSEATLDKKESATFVEESYNNKKTVNFLDKLFQLIQENKVLEEHIPDHLITIVFAGNDTTATTMTNLLLMLSIHQDIQEKVYQEIMKVCPDPDRPVSQADAARLTYCEMVCKETMRLFPVGPLLGREATQDINLDDKFTIPAGSMVGVVIYKLHRDPKIWGPDAEKFNPDNFTPDKVSQRHPYAYLPFSGGPRNCIGVRYAWISMKIMLVHILRKYRLKTTLTMDTLEVKYSITMKILNGCPVTLENRK